MLKKKEVCVNLVADSNYRSAVMGCDHCKIRGAYDKNPESFIGRLWRWHIGFCPGWKKYFKGLAVEKQQELSTRYDLK
jgi:hypothetical protein